MRSFMLVAMLVPLLCVGCAKRTAKNKTPSRDETVSVNPQPQPAAGDDKDKSQKDDGPNWLNDPRFKKEESTGGQSGTGKQSWGISPPQGGWQGPNPGVSPMPPAQPVVPGAIGPMPTPQAPIKPPVAGALQPQLEKPPTSTTISTKRVEMADMKEVWIYIENRSGASGKMPSPAEVYTALVAAKSPAAELVKDGAIILTNEANRESVWAYEAKARTQGGLVVSQNGVETLTAEQLKARLGK